jgi:hypothetical protein
MSWQWRQGEPEIDDMINNLNRKMRALSHDVRSRLSTEWAWTTIEPCDPCSLAERVNRQLYEMTNIFRQATDKTFSWRRLSYEGDLDEFFSQMNRSMRRLQWAVNTASASTIWTVYPDNVGYVTNNETVGGAGCVSWSALRSLGTDTVSFAEGKDQFEWLTAEVFACVTAGQWDTIIRGFVSFDTSSVTGTVDAATFSIKVLDVEADNGLQVGLYAYTPGVTLPATEFNPPDSDDFWNDILSASAALASDTTPLTSSLSLDDVVEFELNAAGISHINQSGVTVFSLFIVNDYDNDEPTASSGADDFVFTYPYNDATEANRPTLAITTS